MQLPTIKLQDNKQAIGMYSSGVIKELDRSNFIVDNRPTYIDELYKERNSLESALKSIFPSNQEESKLLSARKTLGNIAMDLSDDELESYLTEFQYLINCWLDSYEKELFDNKTLNQ